MKPVDIISVILLVAGLLLIFFTDSMPLTILAFVLIVVGGVLVKATRRNR